jgi:glycogen synthase
VKLLLYSHAFPPSVGGVETIVATLARGLAKLPGSANGKTVQVTVVTETPAAKFDDASFPCRIVRRPGITALARLIAGSDVVHIAGPAFAPMLLAWLRRKPYVVEHHGYQAICPNGLLLHQPEGVVCPGHFQACRYRKCVQCESHEQSWFRSLIKVLLNIPRHFLATRAASNVAVSRHVMTRIALPRATVIYHGLDSSSLTASQPAPTQQTESRNIRFGYVGRFVPEKGIPTLLEAAQKLRRERQDFEVVLVGDGPLRPQIEDSIRLSNAAEFIRIAGFLDGQKLADSLNSLDVVVMPSIWEETAGLAAIEQMMRGRLVIVSDIGGLGEIVGDAGLKFPPGDAQRLTDQMRKVLEGTTELPKLAQDRARFLFDPDRMLAEHAALYRQALGAKSFI